MKRSFDETRTHGGMYSRNAGDDDGRGYAEPPRNDREDPNRIRWRGNAEVKRRTKNVDHAVTIKYVVPCRRHKRAI